MTSLPAVQAQERALLEGDLSALSEEQRLSYYKSVCESVGLNPLTQPLAYIKLNGKLRLYALKAATDQVAALRGIVVEIVDQRTEGELRVVTVRARAKDGAQTDEIGVVPVKGLAGEAMANAMMKCVTKAKRRAILSISGLGMLDETEVGSIPEAKAVQFETLHAKPVEPEQKALSAPVVDESAEKAAMGGKMAELKGRFDKAGIGAEWKKVRDTRLPWPFPGTLAELNALVAELEATVGKAENATPPEAPNASEEIVDAALSVKQSKARIGLIKREWLKLCGNNMETRDSEWAAWATKEGANLDDEKSEDHLLLSLYVGVMERGLKARKERK